MEARKIIRLHCLKLLLFSSAMRDIDRQIETEAKYRHNIPREMRPELAKDQTIPAKARAEMDQLLRSKLTPAARAKLKK